MLEPNIPSSSTLRQLTWQRQDILNFTTCARQNGQGFRLSARSCTSSCSSPSTIWPTYLLWNPLCAIALHAEARAQAPWNICPHSLSRTTGIAYLARSPLRHALSARRVSERLGTYNTFGFSQARILTPGYAAPFQSMRGPARKLLQQRTRCFAAQPPLVDWAYHSPHLLFIRSNS